MSGSKEKILLIAVGHGSTTGYISDNCRLESYWTDPDKFVEKLGDRYDLEGAWVRDVREIVLKHPMYALQTPFVGVNMPPGTVKRFNMDELRQSPIAAALLDGAGGGAMRGVVAAGLAGIASFDTVALDVFLQWWRVRGARIGQVIDGAIKWEQVTP